MANVSSSNGLEKRPKLRFPGFDEPWKATAFGELVHEFNDRTKEEDEDTLLSAAIEGMFLNTELFGHQRGASNKGYKKIKYGTMVLSTQNLHLGNANVNQRFKHGMVSPAYKTYDITGCSVDLIAQWIKSEAAKRFFYNATTVGASVCRRNVEWDTLYEQPLYLPCLDEQEKVARFLSLVSERISKQQQFVTALKKYRRGLLEAFLAKKIRFSNNGSPYEDWKWITLSELGDFFGGLSGKTKEDFGHGTDSFITYMNVYKNTFATSDGIMPVSINPSEKQNHIQYGDVLFTQSSETVEEVGLSSVWLHESRPYLNSFCMALRPYDLAKINPMYLGYVLRSQAVREQIMKEGQGISRINLSGSRILKIGFWMPSYAEQNKIVDVLMRLDEICRTSREKLNELSVMKSSIMQQLFI